MPIWKKTLMLGKIEGKRRRWQQRMRWHPLDAITNLDGHKFGQALGDGEGQRSLAYAFHRVAKSRT